MPSLTTQNCKINTISQQEKLLLKKPIQSPMDSSSSNYNNFSKSPSPLPKETIEFRQSINNTNEHQHNHHHHHHQNHIHQLSKLDCYTLKNEIVKLNPKSSYCFDNNTYDYGKSTNWKENIQYHKDDLVCYNRQYYKVIQDVLSEKDQTPDITYDYYILIISRVSRVASKRVLISKWTPYCRFISKGEQVFYDGKVWTALVSQNYEENKKKNPLYVPESPDQPSQKGLWEIEEYNIDELEIVDDKVEFSEDEETSIQSQDEAEDDADIDSNSTITEGDNSFISDDISKELNHMEVSSPTSSNINTNTLKNDYIHEICRKESESNSTNSDNTINEEEEDINFLQNNKKRINHY
ncbi:hypothetical protein H8356DRAFT_1673584 [Neocallimastix lanati (nom. inval.)]|jgi:hypothetical protein|uniref:Uncharacterized protein n=1 Tax=Neocallimastix californiae TaxID=1754190 RepID=A0A1Y2CMX3_9FUNG|nr:hypothetical protein H8356DRAFT_1673584 [Neocallimastix sp. JGI-2020a]ORY48381.1 hypothetical protein LY90DRAFT_703175 [Neocallimastix californiae]|eukprot:ORY48381.1 hypothetical protein LY90DRAFT_703175 [Neocallimastix californiae]